MNERENEANDDKNELRSIGIDRYERRLWIIFIIINIPLLAWFMTNGMGLDRHWGTLVVFPIFTGCFCLYKANNRKYMDCPYCEHSVLIEVNWQCDWCKNSQGKAKRINERCNHCNKYLRTAFCEHCHREFRI